MSFSVAALAVCAVALIEIAFAGHDYPYHAGWFNVAIVAVWIVAAWRARVRLRSNVPMQARVALAAIVLGSGMAGVATVASGLLAPDAQTIVGAPGQRVNVPGTGDWLAFPLTGTQSQDGAVVLQRARGTLTLDRPRQAGGYVYRAIPRNVVSVDARDLSGNRLTITQPEGKLFLSPVLLMTQTQNISGLDLPYDGFSIPAARRNVKAVLFSPQAAAAVRSLPAGSGPAVLFAVDDERGQPLPHGIALSTGGAAVRAGNLLLAASAFQYPAIQIVSAPPWLPTGIGTLLAIAGVGYLAFTVSRRR